MNRLFILIFVLVAILNIAVEATVVSTAMPGIINDLNGFELYSWVFSAFLIAQTTSAVIFGQLTDLYGRKLPIVSGLFIFMTASVLCGFSESMIQLVIFRFIQGIGAGAILPVCITIVGDLFDISERAKAQASIASVWASSSIAGPLIGGFIVSNYDWAWIFWVSTPLSVIAMVGFVFFLKGDVKKQRYFDTTGSITFSFSTLTFLLFLLSIGTGDISISILLFVFCALSTFTYHCHSKKIAFPFINFKIWFRPQIIYPNMATMFGCMATVGISIFIPLFIQKVMNGSPVLAGFAVTAVAMGWPVGATYSGTLVRQHKFKTSLIAGAVALFTGTILYTTLDSDSFWFLPFIGSLTCGFGMGLITSTCMIIVQECADYSERGTVSGAHVFARNLGNAIGAAVLGIVFNLTGEECLSCVRAVENYGAGEFDVSTEAIFIGLHSTFFAMALIALVAGLFLYISIKTINSQWLQRPT
ncbi:MFS transporter [Alteromonas sp. RKMC-009]|uniref:MFS transporter n=1 Tax=Alteromonas sp. RKMC-009 TaxID=2267264 RepID=UPI001E30149E|nr:MFS transporter [Alteromonas sp. RKMC-009]